MRGARGVVRRLIYWRHCARLARCALCGRAVAPPTQPPSYARQWGPRKKQLRTHMLLYDVRSDQRQLVYGGHAVGVSVCVFEIGAPRMPRRCLLRVCARARERSRRLTFRPYVCDRLRLTICRSTKYVTHFARDRFDRVAANCVVLTHTFAVQQVNRQRKRRQTRGSFSQLIMSCRLHSLYLAAV